METQKDDWCRVTLAMRPEEKEMLTKNARLSRRTIASYVLRLCEKTPIYVIDGLPEFISELGKIGKNFNQLVKLANTQKYIDKEIVNELHEFKSLLANIDRRANALFFTGHLNQPDEEIKTLNEIKEMLSKLIRK